MVRRPTIRSGAVFGVALGGLLAGHAMAYAELAPDPTARAGMLAATGHGYLHGADAVAIVGVVAGLAVMFLGRLTAASDRGATVRSFAPRIAAFQVIGFVVMEVAERLSVGAPFGGLAHTLPVGIAFQIALALVSAWFLRWLLRVADRVADRLEGATVERRSGSTPIRLSLAVAHAGPAIAGFGNRGPPPLAR
jgi:hypothetical protein